MFPEGVPEEKQAERVKRKPASIADSITSARRFKPYNQEKGALSSAGTARKRRKRLAQ
jgi:hypothetical protein